MKGASPKMSNGQIEVLRLDAYQRDMRKDSFTRCELNERVMKVSGAKDRKTTAKFVDLVAPGMTGRLTAKLTSRTGGNENTNEHIQFLANKKQTKDNAQLREQAAQAKKDKKRQRDAEEEERQNAPLPTIVDASSRGRQRKRTDFGGSK